MFNDKQIQLLGYEIDSSRVKTREKGSVTLSYVEAHDVIETANKVFGYGNWSYTISKLEQVSQETNHNQNIVICYKAQLQVQAYDLTHAKNVTREDVGFGTGIAKTLADAHEGAAKEAVTDAIKRALRSFGNQFGNSLYDKSKNHHTQQTHHQPPMQQIQQQSYSPNQQSAQVQQQTPQDYASLYNLGLTIMERGNSLVVVGEDIFAKKDSIRACGFRWDSQSKLWYKPLEQQVA